MTSGDTGTWPVIMRLSVSGATWRLPAGLALLVLVSRSRLRGRASSWVMLMVLISAWLGVDRALLPRQRRAGGGAPRVPELQGHQRGSVEIDRDRARHRVHGRHRAADVC